MTTSPSGLPDTFTDTPVIRDGVSADEQQRLSRCFACGVDNEAGLHLDFHETPDGNVQAVYTPQPDHQGWPLTVHGGIIATLLDEAAAYVAFVRGGHAATARLTMRFAQAARMDQPLIVTGTLIKHTRRVLDVEARVTTLDGVQLASAQAALLVLSDDQKRAYGLAELAE